MRELVKIASSAMDEAQMVMQQDTKSRLLRRKSELENELQSVDEAIKLFEDHPEIPQALDLIGKIHI